MDTSALVKLRQALLAYKSQIGKKASEKTLIAYGDAQLQVETFETILSLTHQRLIQVFLTGVNPTLKSFTQDFPRPVLAGSSEIVKKYLDAIEKAIENQLALEEESLRVKEELEKKEGEEPLGVLVERLKEVERINKAFVAERARLVKTYQPLLRSSLTIHQQLLASLFPNFSASQIISLQEQLLSLSSDSQRRSLVFEKLNVRDFPELEEKGIPAAKIDQLVNQAELVSRVSQESVKAVFTTLVKQDIASTTLLLLPKELITNPQLAAETLRQAREEIVEVMTNESSITSLLVEERLSNELTQVIAKYAPLGITVASPKELVGQIINQAAVPTPVMGDQPLVKFLTSYEPHQQAKKELGEQIKDIYHSGLLPGIAPSASDALIDQLVEIALEESLLATASIPESIKKEDIPAYIQDEAREAIARTLIENHALLSREQVSNLVNQISQRLQTASKELSLSLVVKESVNQAVNTLSQNQPEVVNLVNYRQPGSESFTELFSKNILESFELVQIDKLPAQQQPSAYDLVLKAALNSSLTPVANKASSQIIAKTPTTINYLASDTDEIRLEAVSLISQKKGKTSNLMEKAGRQLLAKDGSFSLLRQFFRGRAGFFAALLMAVTPLFSELAPGMVEDHKKKADQARDTHEELEKKEHSSLVETGLAMPLFGLYLYLNRSKILLALRQRIPLLRKVIAYRRLARLRKLAKIQPTLPSTLAQSLAKLRFSHLFAGLRGEKISLGTLFSANLKSHLTSLFPGGNFIFSPAGLGSFLSQFFQPGGFFSRFFSFLTGIGGKLSGLFNLGNLTRLASFALKALGPVGQALSLLLNSAGALAALLRGRFSEALRQVIPKEVKIAIYALVGAIIAFFLLLFSTEAIIQTAFCCPS